MLVKKSIVENWYRTDSWVYKNFSYLFKNKLWQTDVPSGFSVCPYFWLSLFSLFIFKPFIVLPINYIILPLMRFVGNPAIWLDKKLMGFLNDYMDTDVKEGIGLGILLTLLFSFVIAAVLFLAGLILMAAYDWYLKINTITSAVFGVWSAISLIVTFFVISIHKAITNTDCKTNRYLWVWLALFLVSAFISFLPKLVLYLVQ